MKYFHYAQSFSLESGASLPGLTIAYHCYGELNAARDNVIWICHALTASSDAAAWWLGMIGPGMIFDTDRYHVVCANILGSCYGTTGPLSINPQTGAPYYHEFPLLTIRDMTAAHILLRHHLGIDRIHLLVGGSMGGYQALEWCMTEGERIKRLALIATTASETAWGISIHTAQRLAIEADPTWKESSPEAGKEGLKAARAIAMLTYRNYTAYQERQTDTDGSKLNGFRAESYIRYQGEKLARRFNAYSYYLLGRAMDSHNIARGRFEATAQALQSIRQKTLVIGISNDLLCPLPETSFLHRHIANSTYQVIESIYGHDGFLTEFQLISACIESWMNVTV